MKPLPWWGNVLAVLALGFAVVWLATLLFHSRSVSRWERQRDSLETAGRAYQDTTSAIRDTLSIGLRTIDSLRRARRDTIVPIRIIRRIDTLRPQVDDETLADSVRLAAARTVIAAQDTIITRQAVRITTLEELVKQDSMAIVLFQRQRGMDSTRIGALEDLVKRAPVGCKKLPLVRIPMPVFGPGYAATLNPATGKIGHGIAVAVIIPLGC